MLFGCTGHPSATLDGDAAVGGDAVIDGAVGSDALDAGIDGTIDAGPDVTPPTIIVVSPTSEANLWLHDQFSIRFSEAIDPATVTTSSIKLRGAADQPIAADVSLDANGRTAFVRAADGAAAIGTLRLDIASTITDLAGNPIEAQTIERSLSPWAKPAALDLGASPDRIAVGIAGDDVIVATAASVGGARRIVAADHTGTAIGEPLGADASHPAAAGSVVAWVDGTTIAAARWSGTAWVALPAPGAGTRPVLAASPSGAVGIAWIDGTGALRAARLVDDAWVAQASPIATTIVSDPALAMPNDTTLVVAFIDRAGSDRVRVATLTTTASFKPQLTLTARPPAGVENHVSIAARGSTLAVGWDEYSGHSLSAHVARSTGGSWTVLPTLDVDMPGDARGTEVAIDSGGDPIAAWVERIEGAYRGFVARFDGTAWVTVGGNAWSGAPARPIVAAQHALWHDRVPVVGFQDTTGIALARFNGPASPRLGLTTRASIAGCDIDPNTPPATLSATGCFTIASGVATPHAGLVPYDLRSELWSDGALKRRWIGLPDGAALTSLASGSLDAPAGTLIVKEFAIDDPGDRTIMETRFLIRTGSGWTGLTYQWRFDGSDADLLSSSASPVVTWGSHDHQYPSRAGCLRCHNSTVGQTLGLRRDQLARRFDYDGILDDQPRVLAQLGVLSAAAVTPIPQPHDPRIAVEQRVRGYLVANCAHCHNPSGECAPLDFRLATPLGSTGLCEHIVPGDPASSRVYQLVSTRPGGMPAAGSLATDPLLLDIMADWIRSLSSCP